MWLWLVRRHPGRFLSILFGAYRGSSSFVLDIIRTMTKLIHSEIVQQQQDVSSVFHVAHLKTDNNSVFIIKFIFSQYDILIIQAWIEKYMYS